MRRCVGGYVVEVVEGVLVFDLVFVSVEGLFLLYLFFFDFVWLVWDGFEEGDEFWGEVDWIFGGVGIGGDVWWSEIEGFVRFFGVELLFEEERLVGEVGGER